MVKKIHKASMCIFCVSYCSIFCTYSHNYCVYKHNCTQELIPGALSLSDFLREPHSVSFVFFSLPWKVQNTEHLTGFASYRRGYFTESFTFVCYFFFFPALSNRIFSVHLIQNTQCSFLVHHIFIPGLNFCCQSGGYKLFFNYQQAGYLSGLKLQSLSLITTACLPGSNESCSFQSQKQSGRQSLCLSTSFHVQRVEAGLHEKTHTGS